MRVHACAGVRVYVAHVCLPVRFLGRMKLVHGCHLLDDWIKFLLTEKAGGREGAEGGERGEGRRD